MMECTGCSACSVICPQQCIAMQRDEDGFLRPQIDSSKCINCHLCKDVCIINNKEDCKLLDDGKMYYAWSENEEVRLTTTSGGIAYMLAQGAVRKKKVVVGVALDKKKLMAEHVICSELEEIEQLKGSKYLQSVSEKAFRELLYMLKQDKKKEALIIGTPCQIHGMNNILKKINLRDQVTLVDIFCHGVPTILLWEKYLSWIKTKKRIDPEKIDYIKFRDKKYSWHTYYMHILSGEREYVSSREKDPFLKLFTMGVFNQKQCFTCEYRNKSGADIRLGDFWGDRFKEREEGFSMVLTLTEKGEQILKDMKNIVCEKVPIYERYGQQHTDYNIPVNYQKGFDMLKKGYSINKLVELHDPFTKVIIRKIKRFVKK